MKLQCVYSCLNSTSGLFTYLEYVQNFKTSGLSSKCIVTLVNTICKHPKFSISPYSIRSSNFSSYAQAIYLDYLQHFWLSTLKSIVWPLISLPFMIQHSFFSNISRSSECNSSLLCLCCPHLQRGHLAGFPLSPEVRRFLSTFRLGERESRPSRWGWRATPDRNKCPIHSHLILKQADMCN